MKCQFAKILVKCHDNTLLFLCAGKNFTIFDTGRFFSNPNNIVPLSTHGFHCIQRKIFISEKAHF